MLRADFSFSHISTKRILRRQNPFCSTIKMEDVDPPPSFSEYISGLFGPAMLLAWSFKRTFLPIAPH